MHHCMRTTCSAPKRNISSTASSAVQLLVSGVAFVMSLAIAGAHHVRQSLITFALARHSTLAGAFVLYGSFNTVCAMIGCVCVLYGARRASGSGLPVRSPAAR